MSHDYTPLPDAIAQDLGVYAACVYGRVWRYCQMGAGSCTAAVQTIADDLFISAPTVKRHLANLVKAGYLSRVGGGKDGRPSTYRQTSKWVMGGNGGRSERSTQVDQKDLPAAVDPDLSDLGGRSERSGGCITEIQGGRSERSTRDSSSSSSSSFLVVPDEGGSRASQRTRPAPKPKRRQSPSSSDIDMADEMQAAFMDACGLDPWLSRGSVLAEVVDCSARLTARQFTAEDVRAAAAAWPECFPSRDPEDIEPPHPRQLAEWVGRRRAAQAMRKAAAASRGGRSRSSATTRGLVPMIER